MKISLSVRDNFRDYAAEVIQRRALIDVRDGLKPSARQILYSMYEKKMLPNKNAFPTADAIGAAMKYYTHGDSSLLGILMRSAQPFSMRYPLTKVKGQIGDVTEAETWAASRYTKISLSDISTKMFKSIEKNTIEKWYDNYNNTSQFPSVLPTLGFWPLIEGSMGIGVALASSVPAFNLKEMNTALIDCLWERDFNIPMPDFPTGAILLNEDEVRESLLKGTGKSAKIRSIIEYDNKKHALKVTEIPPLTYTNKISLELQAIMEEPDSGIVRFVDATGREPLIYIYLAPGASPDIVINRLYKDTSLQNTYSINMTMLDGNKPRVFGLKEAMKRHLEHEELCYRRAFEFDLNKIKDRLHIIEGLLIACDPDNIETIINLIRKSKTKIEAKTKLIEEFNLSEKQAVAILAIKLSQLAQLEVQKFINEKEELIKEASRINKILSDDTLMKKEIEYGLREVMLKYGDARRTRITNMISDDTRILYMTQGGKLYVNRPKNETVISTVITGQPYLVVTRGGVVYRQKNDINIARAKQVVFLNKGDTILNILPDDPNTYLSFINDEKKFRCIANSSLNKTRTTLTLKNLTRASLSQGKITKADYIKNNVK